MERKALDTELSGADAKVPRHAAWCSNVGDGLRPTIRRTHRVRPLWLETGIPPRVPSAWFDRQRWAAGHVESTRSVVFPSSEERRGGKGCVSTCRSGGWPY